MDMTRKTFWLSWLLPLMLLTVSARVAAQTESSVVTGLVTDAEKQPLIGVTVTVVGTETRAVTDMDGMFKISAPSKSSTELEFNYIGF